MRILFNFLISITIFIYGINLFSTGFANLYQKNIKTLLEKYTKTPFRGIIFGTIITAIVQSSTLVTITTTSLVNASLITFHNSLGIIMGANLGTCVTSFLVSAVELAKNSNVLILLNPTSYLPLILILGLFYAFKKHPNKSNILMGFGLFMLGLLSLKGSLEPIKEYAWFKNLLLSFNNPLMGVIVGIITTSLIQSSSATIAILQTISESNHLTYQMVTPIIMGENIGSCLTTIVASLNTSLNAKKVAISHLFYNIIGTIIFLIIFYLINFLKLNILQNEVNSLKIALIHTLFNFFSILIFYPFLSKLENFINRLVK